jgi:hypothetical protein
MAAALPLLLVVPGCQMWNAGRINLDRFRDERAVDVERRVDRVEPIVKSPF